MIGEKKWIEVAALAAAIDSTYLDVRKEMERRLPGSQLFHVGPTAFHSLYCQQRLELEVAVPAYEMQRPPKCLRQMKSNRVTIQDLMNQTRIRLQILRYPCLFAS